MFNIRTDFQVFENFAKVAKNPPIDASNSLYETNFALGIGKHWRLVGYFDSLYVFCVIMQKKDYHDIKNKKSLLRMHRKYSNISINSLQLQ